MKKNYQEPTMRVVKVKHSQMLCSSVTSVESDVGFKFGGGGNSSARTRECSGYSDDWDE